MLERTKPPGRQVDPHVDVWKRISEHTKQKECGNGEGTHPQHIALNRGHSARQKTSESGGRWNSVVES